MRVIFGNLTNFAWGFANHMVAGDNAIRLTINHHTSFVFSASLTNRLANIIFAVSTIWILVASE